MFYPNCTRNNLIIPILIILSSKALYLFRVKIFVYILLRSVHLFNATFQGRRNIFYFGGGLNEKKVYRRLSGNTNRKRQAYSDFSGPTFEKLFKIYKNTDMQLCIDHLIS
jgi:hypothetical protein